MDLFGVPLPGPPLQFPPHLAGFAQKSQRDEGIQADSAADLLHRLGTADLHSHSGTGKIDRSENKNVGKGKSDTYFVPYYGQIFIIKLIYIGYQFS
jgi:hypothetical protein